MIILMRLATCTDFSNNKIHSYSALTRGTTALYKNYTISKQIMALIVGEQSKQSILEQESFDVS